MLFVSNTFVPTTVLIFSSCVQHSDTTSARSRSEELLLQMFVSRETYADVWACLEGRTLILVFAFFELTYSFSLNMTPDVYLAWPRIGADRLCLPVSNMYHFVQESHIHV